MWSLPSCAHPSFRRIAHGRRILASPVYQPLTQLDQDPKIIWDQDENSEKKTPGTEQKIQVDDSLL